MYISDIDKKRLIKTVLVYTCFTMFGAFFGAVYEKYSHEVYSYYMIYAFAVPLVMGVFAYSLILVFGKRSPKRLAFNLYNSGVAALTVGFIIKGMLDIYGTTNSLLNVYFAAGIPLVIAGIIAYALQRSYANKSI